MHVITISHGSASPKALEQLEKAGCRVITKAAAGDTFFAVLACLEPDHGLTPRQVEVLRLAAQGLSVVKTAEKLNISRKTVERHMRHIRLRLKVTSDVQLGVVVERLGL